MIRPLQGVTSRRLLIAGGGIAGSALLRACRRFGIEAQLVEASDGRDDVGLGVNLPGNAVRALRALGVADRLRAVAADVRRREYRSARDRLLFAVDEADFWGERDTPMCARRGDLIDALRVDADPAAMRFGRAVTGVKEVGGGVEVSFTHAPTEQYEFVVGADGVHSAVRTSLFGAAETHSALLSSASWRFVTTNPGVPCWCAWSGAAGTLLLIPLDADHVYGYASATAGGTVGRDPRWLRQTFAEYPELARRAVTSALAEPSTLYHSPVEEVRTGTWHQGRVVLIGDAAHATAPVWAQGAALAAEDALVLAELLGSGLDWAEVGEEYERRRRSRVAHVQHMTDRLSRTARLPVWLRDTILPFVGPRIYRATFGPLQSAVTARTSTEPFQPENSRLIRRTDVDVAVVDGHRIAFSLTGEGPPVILIGGFVGDAWGRWHRQIVSLSRTHTVLAWDAPGSGGSSDVPDSFRLPDYADSLAGLASVLDLKQPVVVGLSFGGALALELFRRHPTLVRGLFLAGAYAGWAGSLPPAAVRARLKASLDASRLPPDQFMSALLPSMFSDAAPSDRVDEFAAGVMRAFRPAGFRTMAAASAEADLRMVLSHIDVPTVVLHADHDVRSPRDVAEALHAAIPNSRLVVLPDAGHVSCVETPDQFTAELTLFLEFLENAGH